jgi:hypothetical protein
MNPYLLSAEIMIGAGTLAEAGYILYLHGVVKKLSVPRAVAKEEKAVVDAIRCATCSVCRRISHEYNQYTNFVDQTLFTLCKDCKGWGKK